MKVSSTANYIVGSLDDLIAKAPKLSLVFQFYLIFVY